MTFMFGLAIFGLATGIGCMLARVIMFFAFPMLRAWARLPKAYGEPEDLRSNMGKEEL